jgi:peptidyl-prolyl cis-trans isomerase SurA
MMLGRMTIAIALLVLAACNTSTQGLSTRNGSDAERPAAAQDEATPVQESAGQAEEEAVAETAPSTQLAANVIHQKPTVSRKGTYIRALVNSAPITNYDVQRRIKFRQLRRAGGGSEAALNELVDEKLKLQEAARLGMSATQQMVDNAFSSFAKNNKATPTQIAGELDKLGIGAEHFKEFIKAQISWTRTVGGKLRAETKQPNQNKAIFELRKSGEAKPETTEYQLQQIIFVVPKDKRPALLKSRRQEAVNFKQRFTNCDMTIDFAKSLKDVTVKNLGRMMQPELPPGWRDEVAATPEGGVTNPKETENGIELLAVCKAKLVSDDRVVQVVSQAKTFESIEEDSSTEGAEFLAELRKNATIIYK